MSGNQTNRKYITYIEAISTDSFAIPPLIIISAKQVQYHWFEDLQEGERITVTDTGYINNQLTFQ
jgi:hypothetical protein